MIKNTLITWGILIILNQIFIFGGCFASHCILASLPHTLFIAVLLNYFSRNKESKNTTVESLSHKKHSIKFNNSNTKTPSCEKCGAKMILRTARKGYNIGNKFWGCSNFPGCKGITKIQ